MLLIKMNRATAASGMLMIHFLVYLLLFLYITTLSLQWATTYIMRAVDMYGRLSMIANHSFLHDSLINDMRTASRTVDQWYCIGPDKLVWQASEHAVGWYVHNSILVRYEGMYDHRNGNWSNLDKTTLSSMVDALHITPLYRDDRVVLVCCTITSGQSTTTLYAAVGDVL